MKGKSWFMLLFVAGILCLFGCDKNDSPLENDTTGRANLIKNPSFEENGNPSLAYWYIRDTSLVKFAQDAPPNGGKWSIYLRAVHFLPLPHSPSYYVPLSPGEHILKFSVYGKSKGVFGSALLVLQKADARDVMAQYFITDSVWTKYAAIDTVNIAAGDSLFVLLHGGGTEIVDGITYFDLIELEPVDWK